MSSLRPYEGEAPASKARRFLAFILDAFLVVLAHTILFAITAGIVSKTNLYIPKQNELEEEMNACYAIQEEAHIYEYVGSGTAKYQNPISQEEMFKKWAYAHIKLAFNNESSKFLQEGIETLEIDANILPASYDDDRLAYFYVNFLKNYNAQYEVLDFNGVDEKVYFYNVLKAKSYTYNDNSLWIYDEINHSIPTLNTEYAIYLYKYMFVDSDFQAGLSMYNLLAKTWQNVWNDEVDLLINSKGYQKHYQVYLEKYDELSRLIVGVSIISYVLAFGLIYVLPVAITTKHISLGKIRQKLLVVDVKGYPNLKWQTIVRTILKFFSFSGFCVVSNFINCGTNSAFVYPLFTIGDVGVSLLTINYIAIFLAFVSFVISIFNKKKTNIADLITTSYVIDLRYYIEHNEANEMINEIDENSKKIEENETIVIDSSTIKKD